MEYLPGAVAYFFGGFIIWASKTLIWKIATHWSKIWVAEYWSKQPAFDVSQSDAQVTVLTVVITGAIVFGLAVVVWSIANYINCKNTQQGFIANLAGGLGIATAFGQDLWLREVATSLTTYTD